MYKRQNVDRVLEASEAVEQAEAWGVRPLDLLRRAEYTHIFTHVEWEMTAYYITAGKEAECFIWAGPDRLAEEIPLPAAFSRFL